jgi:hypothetical protein
MAAQSSQSGEVRRMAKRRRNQMLGPRELNFDGAGEAARPEGVPGVLTACSRQGGERMARTRTTLAQRWGRLALQILLLALASSATAADDPNRLAEEALAANPGLEALRARIAELGELERVAGTWADPLLAIE